MTCTTLEFHVAIIYYLLISSVSIDFGDYLISFMYKQIKSLSVYYKIVNKQRKCRSLR